MCFFNQKKNYICLNCIVLKVDKEEIKKVKSFWNSMKKNKIDKKYFVSINEGTILNRMKKALGTTLRSVELLQIHKDVQNGINDTNLSGNDIFKRVCEEKKIWTSKINKKDTNFKEFDQLKPSILSNKTEAK